MIDVCELFKNDYIGKEVLLGGWIRNHRKQKEFGFIDFNDGTCFQNLQIVYDNSLKNFDDIQKLHIGSAITVRGTIIKSEGNGQAIEMKLMEYTLCGDCPEDYPIQPKRHTREFLREQAYLRTRTNLFGAVFRVRSVAAYAIHKYFQDKGYVYFHAPIITASDCEGAGEMFQVTTLDMDRIAKSGEVDYSKDFFGKKAALTVSGQLQAETFAMSYKKVYTFGPTFRAENSNTKTHASEFWMIEPEIAFCDLEGDMDIMEDMLKYVVKYVLDNCPNEMSFFDKFVEKGLLDKLHKLINSKFTRIDHEEVISILKKAPVKWEFAPEYGEDIAREHEKYITEYFNGPVFIKNWPKDIKAFYMKQNDDGKTGWLYCIQPEGYDPMIALHDDDVYEEIIRGEFPEIDYEADSFGDVSLNIGSGKEEFFEFFYRNKNSGAANLIHYAYDLCICPTHIEADILALGKGHYSDEIEVPILDDEKTWLNR